jgi:hypothetical protein
MSKEPTFNDRAIHYYTKLTSLLKVYSESKEAILLSEKFDPDGKIYLAPLNELRSAFDHVMRACHTPEEIENQFDEAETHIRRAGYDAYEIFNVHMIQDELDSVKKYKSSIIAQVFPEYYTSVIPTFNDIKKDIASIRAHRKIISSANHVHFAEYFEKSQKLIDISSLISTKIPGLEAYSVQVRKENIIARFWYWSITILVAAGFFFLGLCFS